MGGISLCLYADRGTLMGGGRGVIMLDGEVIVGVKSLRMWE